MTREQWYATLLASMNEAICLEHVVPFRIKESGR